MQHIRYTLPWHHRHQFEETYKIEKDNLNGKNLKKDPEKDL